MKELNFIYQSRIIYTIKFCIITSIVFQVNAKAGQIFNKVDTVKIQPIFVETDTTNNLDTMNLEFPKNEGDFNEKSISEVSDGKPSFWTSYILDPVRLGLKYEIAYKVIKPTDIKKDRLSLRLEYSKLLFNKFSLQVDSKLLSFMKDDHRTRKSTFWINDHYKEVEMSFGERTREAYLQTSFHKTSIKAGIQTLVWGESDFATVTDELSPMDYREPLNLNLDELRTGQLMLTVDQFSPFGDWSAFFIPYPEFNKYPKKGTGYYYDPFNGSIEFQKEKQNGNFFEYGIKWKKTFGQSDISIMAANLIDNEYASRMINPILISQSKWRYSMAGMTFNYAINKFLFKGEVAMKSPKAYNDTLSHIVKKDNLDASFGFDYSVNSTFTISMEGVNYHIIGWNKEIQSVPENNYMLLLILSKTFMRDNLSVNWVTMYNGPNNNFFNLLTTYYNWSDHITLYFDVLIPYTNNSNSGLYIYRDQKQVAFKIQYQF